MISRIITIGNSKGIRIPKPLLEQSGLKDEVEIIATKQGLVIRPKTNLRAGWSEAFAEMAKAGDDELLDPPTTSKWDRDQWTW
ncbi:MAG: AbrB/MazE/SpoVT family DNA-binding domain-containing protein [Planctomycetales bacterium]|nr:AbrB/MazE/SpoVT family DNA-binding domain-containing protein [Planctomycetales bacterium]MBN8624249.1 AbrB/MazE/SpoVT family DNA-binding domain-containing protein [Planctomycetota bacterium]